MFYLVSLPTPPSPSRTKRFRPSTSRPRKIQDGGQGLSRLLHKLTFC